VFVGTVCERKGLEDLRRAFLRLRDAGSLPDALSVTIVGDARQEGPGVFERVRDAYAAAGLTMVTFVGARPLEEVRAALARSDIFVLPSHWEGLPLSLLEAMAAGTAVVATRVGDVPEVLDEGRAGVLVSPERPEELASSLARLLGDAEERIRLGDAARRRVREHYDRSAMTARLLQLYRELAHSR
jgi:glycosyltransferase involved in cell wall biosynthesis